MLSASADEQKIFSADTVTTECRLLECALFGADFSFSADCDWQAVYNDLFSQTVDAIPGNLLTKIPADEAVKSEWRKTCFWRIGQFYKLMATQNEMVKILTDAKLDFVILKGTAAAMYYPEPQYRAMGDIDFLVAPEHFEKAYDVLIKNGFIDADGDFHRHINLIQNGCELEMHRYFSLKGDSDELRQLDSVIFDGLKNAELAKIDGNNFPVLPPLQNGLTLLQHIKHHIRRSLGMRQILDWMLFVNKELNDEMWNSSFAAEAEKAGLSELAICITRMCQLHFGLTDDITWCKNADIELCDRLFNHVVTCGNMGEKRTEKLQQASDIRGGILSLVKNLQSHGKKSWKLLEKLPFLVIFAWAYQLCHHIKTLFKYGISPSKMLQYKKESNRDEIMFKKLGCEEDIIGN